jgi:hypothetical protein
VEDCGGECGSQGHGRLSEPELKRRGFGTLYIGVGMWDRGRRGHQMYNEHVSSEYGELLVRSPKDGAESILLPAPSKLSIRSRGRGSANLNQYFFLLHIVHAFLDSICSFHLSIAYGGILVAGLEGVVSGIIDFQV